jgi:hypothetical protein
VEVVGDGLQIARDKNAPMFRCLLHRFPQEGGEIPAISVC